MLAADRRRKGAFSLSTTFLFFLRACAVVIVWGAGVVQGPREVLVHDLRGLPGEVGDQDAVGGEVLSVAGGRGLVSGLGGGRRRRCGLQAVVVVCCGAAVVVVVVVVFGLYASAAVTAAWRGGLLILITCTATVFH